MIDPGDHERVDGSWLVMEYESNPTIRLDARVLDRVLAIDSDLILEVDDARFEVRIAGGDAAHIAASLAPFTRSAPITRETYEYAKHRLAVARGEESERAPVLFLGDDAVRATDEYVYVGHSALRIEDVALYGEAGAALPLPKGTIRAALPMILVADRSRTEDQSLLVQRIADYELREKRD